MELLVYVAGPRPCVAMKCQHICISMPPDVAQCRCTAGFKADPSDAAKCISESRAASFLYGTTRQTLAFRLGKLFDAPTVRRRRRRKFYFESNVAILVQTTDYRLHTTYVPRTAYRVPRTAYRVPRTAYRVLVQSSRDIALPYFSLFITVRKVKILSLCNDRHTGNGRCE